MNVKNGLGREGGVSLIVSPADSFLVPFLSSLAFVCCPWSLLFDLGRGLWPKVGLSPISLPPHPLSLEDELAEGSPHLPSELVSGAPGFLLSLPHRPHHPFPSCPSSPAQVWLLSSRWGPHSTLTMAAEYQGLPPTRISL